MGKIRFSDRDIRQFQALIQKYSGIEITDRRFLQLEDILSNYLMDRKFATFDQYYQDLRLDGHFDGELKDLISLVTINETRFFRDILQFNSLKDAILPILIRSKKESGQDHLRIWCAGCSIGSEAYSIAILLSEQVGLLNEFQVEILATDIRWQNIDYALNGSYTSRELRGLDQKIIGKYFGQIENRYQLNRDVMDIVQFKQFNLKDTTYLTPGVGKWDIILCCNVMIYFSRDQRRETVQKFSQTLSSDGYFFIGHAESLLGISSGLSLFDASISSIYQRKNCLLPPKIEKKLAGGPTNKKIQEVNLAQSKFSLKASETVTFLSESSFSASGTTVVEENSRTGKELVQTHFSEAEFAANRGDYQAAIDSYHKVIRIEPFNVSAHFFLGLALENTSDIDEAVKVYHRTIELDDTCILSHVKLARIYSFAGIQHSAVNEYRKAILKLKQIDPAEEIKYSGGFSAALLLNTCSIQLKKLDSKQ
ncbi:hypothetical protein CMK12_06640 [Candidatus Poribacteria bacterium]|nr:hypothetical protein [Candidatus Poribacteria bacterium]